MKIIKTYPFFLITLTFLPYCQGVNLDEIKNNRYKIAEIIDGAGDTHFAEKILKSEISKANPNPKKLEKIKEYLGNISLRRDKIKLAVQNLKLKIITTQHRRAIYRYQFQLGYMYDLINKKSQAHLHYNKSIELKPNTFAYIKRGLLFERAGNIQKAKIDINKAFKLEPKEPLTNFHLALFLIRQKKIEKARYYATRLKKNWPEFSQVIYELIKEPVARN